MNHDLALEWFDRWERQQEHYAVARTDRFEVVCDVLAAAPAPPAVVIDVGCGPGSLAAVVSHAFPGTTVIGIDIDPFLLALGAAVHPDIDFRQADLGTPGWADDLRDLGVGAVVTSTALHYPSVPVVAAIYRECALLLRPGGVVVNADHLFADSPGLQEIATEVGERAADRRDVRGQETWHQWWGAVADEPEFADLLSHRARDVPVHGGDNELTADQHREIMLASGFAEAGTVWQMGISSVLVGIAPSTE
ncbi:class I SAM-dependent methyltransferase [Gordonia sp. NPDC058843]|uniref:class I SAM-dependent methyltransferase n=1 Tax=Gordonia sp. NPDC058843 TaxID=3346648 RepID=UPI00369ADBD3